MTAYYLVHILHSLVGHLDFASVDDLSKNVVLGKIIYDLKKFLSMFDSTSKEKGGLNQTICLVLVLFFFGGGEAVGGWYFILKL